MAKTKTTKKTVTVKPKPVKKSAVSPEKKELVTLLNQLSREEISWLITQTKTMIYNHKVDEVNSAARELEESRKKTGSVKKAGTVSPNLNAVDIVQAGGPKNFNILLGNARLFVNLDELKAMVKIAQASEDPDDGAGRLYRWCRKERNDILLDGDIAGPADPRLRQICNILRDKFSMG